MGQSIDDFKNEIWIVADNLARCEQTGVIATVRSINDAIANHRDRDSNTRVLSASEVAGFAEEVIQMRTKEGMWISVTAQKMIQVLKPRLLPKGFKDEDFDLF